LLGGRSPSARACMICWASGPNGGKVRVVAAKRPDEVRTEEYAGPGVAGPVRLPAR
jgi:hypothetical protein